MLFDNRKLTEIAQVAKIHGLNGHLSLKFADNFSEVLFDEEIPVFFLIEGLPVPFFVEDYRNSGGYTATKFRYIDNSETAEKYIGCRVFVFEDDIPDYEDSDEELEFIGYKVFDAKYGYIGCISDFNLIPGNPVFETDFNGKTIIIPYSEDIVVDINDDKQEIYIEAPDGLIDLYME